MAAKSESASSSFRSRVVETLGADAIDQLDDAEASVAKSHGHGHDRLRFHLRLFVDLAKRSECPSRCPATTTVSPCCATQPAIPCPILMRTSFRRLGGLADGQFEVEFLLGLIQQQQRPVVRAQKLVDFLHDGAENLIELQRRGQRLAQLLEDGDFARFALLGGDRGIAAAFDGWKLIYFVHAQLVPALKVLQARL